VVYLCRDSSSPALPINHLALRADNGPQDDVTDDGFGWFGCSTALLQWEAGSGYGECLLEITELPWQHYDMEATHMAVRSPIWVRPPDFITLGLMG
jgi:hypothetical protein